MPYYSGRDVLDSKFAPPDWWGSDRPYRICDWVEGLKSLPDGVIDCAVTSPPYWGLRDYQTEPVVLGGDDDCEHEWGEELSEHHPGQVEQTKWKDAEAAGRGGRAKSGQFCQRCGAWRGQVGLEPTYEDFVKHLCDGFDEVRRVLKDTGTVFVNLGDTYSSNLGGNRHGLDNVTWASAESEKKRSERIGTQPLHKKPGNLPDKCLVMIPSRFAIEMIDRGWILRNTIIWHRPNAMPESSKDRFTNDWEYIFFFTKKKHYHFNQQFELYTESMNRWGGQSLKAVGTSDWDDGTGQDTYRDRDMRPDPRGKNRRAVWSVNSRPYEGSHFAVYPAELLKVPIEAGCPEFVCRACGKIRERMYEDGRPLGEQKKRCGADSRGGYEGQATKDYAPSMAENPSDVKRRILEGMVEKRFVGWDECDCDIDDKWRPGIVLDPFLGSGTTVVAAMNLGRLGLGFELNPDYEPLIAERIKYRNREKKSRLHVRKAKDDKKQAHLDTFSQSLFGGGE